MQQAIKINVTLASCPHRISFLIDAFECGESLRRDAVGAGVLQQSVVADRLTSLVQPHGVAVHLEAAHLCTQMRGVAEESSRTVTTFWRGLYDEDADLRREFLDEARSHRHR